MLKSARCPGKSVPLPKELLEALLDAEAKGKQIVVQMPRRHGQTQVRALLRAYEEQRLKKLQK